MVERGPGPFGPDTHPDNLLLSDYLVGTIDDPMLTRSIEEHLASCEACRQVLAELGEVVRLLDQLPEPAPPRSFRLTPEMAGVRPGAAESRLLRLVPVVRWAGLIAAVFLVALLVTDAVVHHSTNPGTATSGPMTTFSTASSASSSSGAEVTSATAASASEPIHPDSGSRSSESTPGSQGAAAAAAGIAQSASTPASGAAAVPSSPAAEAFGAIGSPAANSAKPTSSSEVASTPVRTSREQTGSSATTKPASTQASASSNSRWHVAELALALLVIWLLLLSVVLPRWHHTRS